MPKHLKHLEHEGNELFLPENALTRNKAKQDKLSIELQEKLKEKTKKEKQEEYLNPFNENNTHLWDEI